MKTHPTRILLAKGVNTYKPPSRTLRWLVYGLGDDNFCNVYILPSGDLLPNLGGQGLWLARFFPRLSLSTFMDLQVRGVRACVSRWAAHQSQKGARLSLPRGFSPPQ